MAVAFDAVGPSSSGAGASALTLTWTHTVAAGPATVIAAFAFDSDAGSYAAPTTVTCGGVTMTALAHINPAAANTAQSLAVYYRTGVSSGAQTITVTTGMGGTTDITGGSISFTGVTGLGTPVTANTANTPSITVGGTAATSMVAAFYSTGTAIGAIVTGTSRFVNNLMGGSGGFLGNCAGGTTAGGGSGTVAWPALTGDVALVAVEVQGAAGGGAGGGGGPQPQQPWPAPMAGVFGPGAPFTGPGAILPPVATITATANLAGAGGVTANVAGFGAYITGITGTYFTDPNGTPRLFVGEDAWGLMANAGAFGTYTTVLDTYFANRAAQGYNCVETSLFSNNSNNNAYVNTDGRDWDGTWPFTTTTDPSSGLNATFWARRDYLFASAAAHGFTVVMSITGSNIEGTSTNILRGWTTTQWSALGTALGTRYQSTPNILWIIGDDYFDTYNTQFSALKTAIRATGDTHPLTIQYNQESTSRSDIPSGSLKTWRADADWDWVYTYNPSYAGIDRAYSEAPSAGPATPMVWGDGNYLATGGITGFVSPQDYALTRRMIWWALSEGARGFSTGDNDIYPWDSGSAALVTSKTFYSAQVPGIVAVFGGLTGWHTLAPDTSNALVTAGRGTKYAGSPPYVTNGGDTYVTASRGPDTGSGASLAVIYMSAATTITIDQTKMASGYTATWVDPASGATSSATPGTTYNSTAKGSNSAGDTDWALVLQAPPVTTATASLAGAGSVAAKATVIAPASLAGAGSVAAKATVITPASLAGAGSVNATGTVPGPVFNDFEGGSNGTAVTTSNAGGTGDTQFDAVNLTAIAFDNAHAAHGSLAAKQTVSNNAAYLRWTTSMGTQSQVWFRLYLYFTAIPSFSGTVWQASNAGGICAGLSVNGAGKLSVYDGAGPTNITTSTAVIPLNAWFRVEGFVVFSATVGQTEVKLFTTMDGATAAETDTSAATQNTRGPATTYDFGAGFQTSPAVYWFDDVGLSSTGYLGPAAVPPGTATLAAAGSVAAVATVIAPAAAAGAGAVTGTAAQGAPGTLAGAGAVAALVTQKAPAAAAGLGALAGLAAEAVTAPLAGAGAVAALVTELAPGTLTGAGALAGLVTEPATASLAGGGTLAALAAEPGAATLAGAGTVTANSGAGATGTAALAAAGAVSAVATVIAPAVLTGAGTLAGVATQAATGTLTGAGAVAAPAVQGATAALAGLGALTGLAAEAAIGSLAAAGSITDVVTQAVTASPAAAGAVTASPAGAGNTAALAGAGSLTALATVAVTASAAGGGSLTALATAPAGASLAGAGSVAGVVTEAATASPAAAGGLSAIGSSAGAATASPAGAGAVAAAATQTVTATAAAAGAVAATVALRGAAALTAAGALSANGQITGTANLAAAAAVTAKAVQAATAAPAAAGTLAAVAAQRAAAALAGAGSVTAASGIQLAFTVGALTASDAPAARLATATAGGGSGGVLTASDTRTGGPG